MATFYTVIQFVPDPVADERVNAGVAVFGEGRILVRFVENWGRLRRFGNKDVTFLKQFARDLGTRIHDGTVTESLLREMAASWKNAIQFTPPRGSLLSLEQLLEDAEGRFLANDHAVGSRPLTRRYMKKLAFDTTCLAFLQRGGEEARRLVKRDFQISGAITNHPFSLAIANGQPLVAAEVFSFVGSSERSQEKDVMATAFAFEDVRRKHAGLYLAALVVVGEETPPMFQEATKVFGGLGVRVVPKDRVDEWTDEVAGKILKRG
jgi:Protein of unknown function (DUF3037)